MVNEVYEALRRLRRCDDVHVVVLTGSGTSFCPGADLSSAGAGALADRPVPHASAYHSARLLAEMPQVTVAAINGGCAGAGLAWAAACDLRIAAERARFSTAFLEVGLASELGLPWTLPRIVGAGIARDLCLLPRKLSAQEALELRLVSRVLSNDSFDSEIQRIVAELAGRRPSALRTLKANFRDAEDKTLEAYLDVETERHHRLAAEAVIVAGES
jgi:2-(1,2-epoxy-1,2-dihydrophenyl)acetyl-CoA isomerase